MLPIRRKKKMEDPEERELKQGAVDKAVSYVMAVPHAVEEISSRDAIVERLKGAEPFHLISYKPGEELAVVLEYNGREYEVTLIPEDLELPELFTINHQLSRVDVEAMKSAGRGITTAMTFGEDILESYQVQLKVLDCVVPGMAGIVDFCSERILSGIWAHMAALSKVPPAPSYLYSIQAINDDSGVVWLHTHGLNRCGSIELEILNSDTEHYQDHATVIQTVAGNIITKEPLGEEKDSFWISALAGGGHLVGTWLDWPLAVRFYGKKLLGGVEDRKEDHNRNTGALFFYLSQEDFEKKRFVPISAYNEQLTDNPIMMISTEETDRMRRLAMERLEYFRREIGKEENKGLMKFGLLVDEEYREEDSANLEHLWFEVLGMEGGTVHCKRTQDAYYIKSLNQGDELDLDISQLTDWILYTPGCQVTPDSVYLLEMGQ